MRKYREKFRKKFSCKLFSSICRALAYKEGRGGTSPFLENWGDVHPTPLEKL